MNSLYQTGYNFYSKKHYTKAIQYFDQIITNYQNDPNVDQAIIIDTLYFKSASLYAKRKYSAAILSFDQALEIITPGYIYEIIIYFYKGTCHRHIQEYDIAEECFRKVLNLHETSEYVKSL